LYWSQQQLFLNKKKQKTKTKKQKQTNKQTKKPKKRRRRIETKDKVGANLMIQNIWDLFPTETIDIMLKSRFFFQHFVKIYYLPLFNIVKFSHEYHDRVEYKRNPHKNHGIYIIQNKMVGLKSVVYSYIKSYE
jgi:hypothetical protein